MVTTSSQQIIAVNSQAPATILVIEDNPDDLRLLSSCISDLGKVVFAPTGEEGIHMAEQLRPDVIVLDIELPDILGPVVFKRIQAQTGSAVIFITSHRGATHQIAALESGAVDFISKPYEPEVIRHSIALQIQQQKNRKAQLKGNRDRITHAYSRAYFEAMLNMHWHEQSHLQGSLAMALVQIDHFQSYSASVGNLNADACLKKVTHRLGQGYLAENEMLARFGKDKFALLVVESNVHKLNDWGSWLVESVANLAIPFDHGSAHNDITASVGLCLAHPQLGQSCEALVEDTYAALTLARESGRNQYAITAL